MTGSSIYDSRPVLLGMNNPLSREHKYNLFPSPRSSAGHRLWMMLHERCGASRAEYLSAFDRRNLITGAQWKPQEARAAGHWARLYLLSRPRVVVVLGNEVRDALGLPSDMPLIHPHWEGPVMWRLVPHPSGRNLWYNEPGHRLVVGLLLEELMDWSQRRELTDEGA